jgi:hypothetical protein
MQTTNKSYTESSKCKCSQHWTRRTATQKIHADPSSRQTERSKSTSLQLSDTNKDVVLNLRCVLYSKTDWTTDRRSYHNINFNFDYKTVENWDQHIPVVQQFTSSSVQLRVQGRECSITLVHCED